MLVFASHSGKIDEVKAILLSGVDVNTKAEGGKTALHVAAVNGNIEIVKLLLNQRGCDANSKDSKGRTPAAFAEAYGRVDMAKLIQSHGTSPSSTTTSDDIIRASFEGNLQLVSQCIKQGQSVSKPGHDGKTALHIAAGFGHLEIVKLLLQNAASVDARDSKGRTPSQFAEQYNQKAAQNIILQHQQQQKVEGQQLDQKKELRDKEEQIGKQKQEQELRKAAEDKQKSEEQKLAKEEEEKKQRAASLAKQKRTQSDIQAEEAKERARTKHVEGLDKTLGVASRPPLADRLEMMLKEVAQLLSSLMKSPENGKIENKLVEITDVMILDIRIAEAVLDRYDDSQFKYLKELACHLSTSLTHFNESCVEGILSSKSNGTQASRRQILRGITRSELGRVSRIIKGLRLTEQATNIRNTNRDIDFRSEPEKRRRMSIQTAAGNPLKAAAFDKQNPMTLTVEKIKCDEKFIISVTNDIKTEEFSTEWSFYIHSQLEAAVDKFNPSSSITKHVVLKQLSHSVNSMIRTSCDSGQVTLDFITRQVNALLICLSANTVCPVCKSFALIDPTTKVLIPPTLFIPQKKCLAHLPCVTL